MMRRSKGACYVLAPTVKVGSEHNFLSGSIDQIDTLITCKGASPQEVRNLRAAGIEVVELEPVKRP